MNKKLVPGTSGCDFFRGFQVTSIWLIIKLGHGWKKLVDMVCIWMFPKIGVPQNVWFIMENPIKVG